MAEPRVVHSDLELFGLAFYRAQLVALAADGTVSVADKAILAGFEVARVEPGPDETFPPKLLVFRDDSGPGELLTAERAIGVSVLMGTKADPRDCKRAAAIFLGLVWQMPTPGDGNLTMDADPVRNPVASVDQVLGPYIVPEDQDRARAYGTATLQVTPEAF